MINNKKILITGGTGFFGQNFTSYLLKNFKPKKIIIFSRDEAKQYYMQQKFNSKRVKYFIGDVRGYGPMIGVEIVSDKESKNPDKEKTQQIISKCKENGLLLVSCGEFGNVIRFMGPLTTPIKQVEEALGIFSESLI